MRELKNVIKEDEMDEQKHATLGEIDSLVSSLKGKVQKLVELDSQGTGTGDLTDQIVTFEKAIMALQGVSARSHKIVPESVREAVGDSADPILDLIEELGSHSIVLDELIRYLDGDTIKDFVEDFRRHNDMPPMKDDADESIAEAEGTRTIKVNKNIDLAGDSIWQGKDRGEEVTYKTFVHEIKIFTDEDGYMSVTVKHEGPWTIYTDSGFEQEISGIIGTPVSFSEQGMQDDGMAHLEGEEDKKQESTMEELDRILKIAGVQKAPVAEETLEEECGCDDPKCDDPKMHEDDEKVDEGRKPYPGEYDYTDEKYMDADGTPKSDDDEDDDKKKKKEKAKESVEEAKKELDEQPNEGNEFAHELKKA